MANEANCRLCGLPNPTAPVREGELAFCCFGCRELFRCFGNDVLAAGGEGVRGPDASRRYKTAYLWIDGMHCSSCELLIERLALGRRGVHAAAASYATSTARIEYDADLIDESDLPAILDRLGYRARLREAEAPEYDERQDLLRLLSGGSLAAMVMMLTMVFIYPLHAGVATAADFEAIRWVAFDVTPKALFVLCSILVFYVGLPILRGAWIASGSAC